MTNLSEKEVATHLGEAKEKKIVVLTKEQLESGINRVPLNVNAADQLFFEAFGSLDTQGRLIYY